MDSWVPMVNVSFHCHDCVTYSNLHLLTAVFVTLPQIEPFKSIVEFSTMQWYYIDIEGQQHGPMLSKLLVHKMKEGEIDGLTLVYGGDNTKEWRKLSEVQLLKNEMAKIAAEEEAMRVAFLKTENANELENQVFVTDFDHVKALHDSITATSSSSGGRADRKTYVADNGQKYSWDEEENDWMEEDEDDASLEGTAVADPAHKKRKAMENDSDDEADERPEQTGSKGAPDDGKAAIGGEIKPKKKRSKKKVKKGPNTWVYVSGLPPDVTAEEIKNHFSKVKFYFRRPVP